MATEVETIYIGSTAREIEVQFVDRNGAPVNISGATEIKLQGKSASLPSFTIDEDMVIHDGPQGLARCPADLVALGDIGSLEVARFRVQGRYTDGSGVDYGQVIEVDWSKPVVAA